MLINFLVWHEKGGVEYVMNFPGRGELDFLCEFGYLGDYLERSVSPW